MTTDRLCSSFAKESSKVWTLLRKARLANQTIGEETVTDLLLLELTRKHLSEITTFKFNKHQEGKNGADWEWWFTGPSNNWFGFRFQAKVINLRTYTFDHLHYRKSNPPIYQSDILIRNALQNEVPLVPIYCLYSNWDIQHLPKPRFQVNSKPSIRNFGCSILTAYSVQNLRLRGDLRNLGSLLRQVYPLHCLVCCFGSTTGDLTERVWQFWRDRLRPIEGLGLAEAGFDENLNLRGVYRGIAPVTQPPRYVELISLGRAAEAPDENLRSVTVFRQ